MFQQPDVAAHASAQEAALALGQLMLETGQPDAALESFSRAARSGSVAALTMIGRIHERGWGRPRDVALAVGYFRRAAAAGDPWAIFNLADLHLAGDGVQCDIREAHRLYAAAAAMGHAKALNMLGILAESGRGPDPVASAGDYFLAAAQAGDPWAQFNIARRLVAEGKVAQACDWLDRSLSAGFPDYWRSLHRELERHPDPSLRARAEAAMRRLESKEDP